MVFPHVCLHHSGRNAMSHASPCFPLPSTVASTQQQFQTEKETAKNKHRNEKPSFSSCHELIWFPCFVPMFFSFTTILSINSNSCNIDRGLGVGKEHRRGSRENSRGDQHRNGPAPGKGSRCSASGFLCLETAPAPHPSKTAPCSEVRCSERCFLSQTSFPL